MKFKLGQIWYNRNIELEVIPLPSLPFELGIPKYRLTTISKYSPKNSSFLLNGPNGFKKPLDYFVDELERELSKPQWEFKEIISEKWSYLWDEYSYLKKELKGIASLV